MIEDSKVELFKCVENLLKSANDRKTKQGVKIYEGALVGIESHGELTPKEFEIVKLYGL